MVEVLDETSSDRADTKSQRDSRDEPTGPEPLAAHVCWDLEDDVTDVEHRKNGVVVVASEAL